MTNEIDGTPNETIDDTPPRVRLGRLPMKTTRKALLFRDFVKILTLPKSSTYWIRKTPIPLRSYGNLEYGCCTLAKQAVAITRMERQEQRRLVRITDQEVVDRYFAMSRELYDGQDGGAYEDDALNRWRDPEKCLRDALGHPYPIKAYLRINALDQDEMKAALALSGPKGIAVALNLPAVYSTGAMVPPATWDVPDGQALIGPWQPGTWGGHSLWCHGYTQAGIVLDHTWDVAPNLLTWNAVAAYCDEAHVVLDSLNAWRTRAKASDAVTFSVANVRDAVNAVSAITI